MCDMVLVVMAVCMTILVRKYHLPGDNVTWHALDIRMVRGITQNNVHSALLLFFMSKIQAESFFEK